MLVCACYISSDHSNGLYLFQLSISQQITGRAGQIAFHRPSNDSRRAPLPARTEPLISLPSKSVTPSHPVKSTGEKHTTSWKGSPSMALLCCPFWQRVQPPGSKHFPPLLHFGTSQDFSAHRMIELSKSWSGTAWASSQVLSTD